MCGKARLYLVFLILGCFLFVCSYAIENRTVTARNVSRGKENGNRVSAMSVQAKKKANSDTRTVTKSLELTSLSSPSPPPSPPIQSSPSSPPPARASQLKLTTSARPQRPKKWITQVFGEAADQFNMDGDVNAECRRDFDLYRQHLQNQTVWAVRMLESSEWPSVGVFSGMLEHFGNYDECLWVNTDIVKGRYCLAQAVYDYEIENYSARHIDGQLDYADETKPAWNAMKMYLDNPVRVNRHKVTWALCIPSTCKSADLNVSLNSLLVPLFSEHGLNVRVNVDPIMCRAAEPVTYTTGYYIISYLYCSIFALVICATIYEIMKNNYLQNLKKESAISAIFRCFSMKKNWKQLVKYDKTKDDATIYLVKILNMIFIIYGHRYIYFIGYPKFNAEQIEMSYKASSIELVHTNVVDVFFMISGFLTVFFGMKPMKKGGVVYLVLSTIFRWIRMVPVFVFIVLFIVNVLPFLSDAPLWNYRINTEVENCATTWWTNLLVVSNIVQPEKQCLVISWYISTDIQLSIIGGILLLIICKNRTFGTVVTILAFIAGTATTFIVAYMNNFYGLLRLYMTLLEEPRKSVEFTKFYVSTYSRLGPYLVGFISAFLVHVLKERMFVFSMRKVWIFFLIALAIGEGCQFYGCLFYLFGREYNRIESAAYASVNRSLFVLPYAVVHCMHFVSGLGKVSRFFQRQGFVILGRLTYSVFLVNTLIQLYHASSQKSLMPTSINMNLYWLAASDVLFSYFFGTLLHFFIEAPICNMSKLMQRNLLQMFMKSQKASEEVVSGAASDTTDKTSEESTEEGRSQVTKENEKNEQNGHVNRDFDATESPVVSESVVNETESSRC